MGQDKDGGAEVGTDFVTKDTL